MFLFEIDTWVLNLTMYNPAITVRRIDVLLRILNGRKTIVSSHLVHAYSSEGKITIGNVSKDITKPKKLEYVPRKYCKYDCLHFF